MPNKNSLKKTVQEKKWKARRDLNPRLRFLRECNLFLNHPLPYLQYIRFISNLNVRIDTWEDLTKKRKQHPSLGDDASMAGVAPGKAERDERGEARRSNTTPNGGPHLELLIERLRLKPGLALTSRLLRRHGHHVTYIYIYSSEASF